MTEPAPEDGPDIVEVAVDEYIGTLRDLHEMRQEIADGYRALIAVLPSLRKMARGDASRGVFEGIVEPLQLLGFADENAAPFPDTGDPCRDMVTAWARAANVPIGERDDLAPVVEQIAIVFGRRLVESSPAPLSVDDLGELAALARSSARAETRDRRLALVELAARLDALAQIGAPLVSFTLTDLALIETTAMTQADGGDDLANVVAERVRDALDTTR